MLIKFCYNRPLNYKSRPPPRKWRITWPARNPEVWPACLITPEKPTKWRQTGQSCGCLFQAQAGSRLLALRWLVVSGYGGCRGGNSGFFPALREVPRASRGSDSTMAPKGGPKQQSEEDLLLQDFSRNLSAKSSALFFGNAFIVSAIPICERLERDGLGWAGLGGDVAGPCRGLGVRRNPRCPPAPPGLRGCTQPLWASVICPESWWVASQESHCSTL